MKLAVRRATSADSGALVALMHDFYAESGFDLDHPSASTALLNLLLEPTLGCIWLAYADHEPAGHAVLTVRYTMEHGGLSGYVDDLYMKPQFRRMHGGRDLLTELFAECRRRGCKSVQVEVGATNSAALKLYAKAGLHPVQDGRILASGLLT